MIRLPAPAPGLRTTCLLAGASPWRGSKRRVAAAAINGHTTRRLPETLLGLVIPVVIILYMLKFSKSYPEPRHPQAS